MPTALIFGATTPLGRQLVHLLVQLHAFDCIRTVDSTPPVQAFLSTQHLQDLERTEFILCDLTLQGTTHG
jgi:dTDP-4-dehydrorhamnose reductase